MIRPRSHKADFSLRSVPIRPKVFSCGPAVPGAVEEHQEEKEDRIPNARRGGRRKRNEKKKNGRSPDSPKTKKKKGRRAKAGFSAIRERGGKNPLFNVLKGRKEAPRGRGEKGKKSLLLGERRTDISLKKEDILSKDKESGRTVLLRKREERFALSGRKERPCTMFRSRTKRNRRTLVRKRRRPPMARKEGKRKDMFCGLDGGNPDPIGEPPSAQKKLRGGKSRHHHVGERKKKKKAVRKNIWPLPSRQREHLFGDQKRSIP